MNLSNNRVMLIGTVNARPHLVRTMDRHGNDLLIATISLTTLQLWRSARRGRFEQRRILVQVTAYRKLAQIARKILWKGQFVQITGHVETQRWGTDDNIKTQTLVIADGIEILRNSDQQAAETSGSDKEVI